jgi:hypothetical protein
MISEGRRRQRRGAADCGQRGQAAGATAQALAHGPRPESAERERFTGPKAMVAVAVHLVSSHILRVTSGNIELHPSRIKSRCLMIRSMPPTLDRGKQT